MQTGIPEFFEDVNDALREAVRAMGGNKAVGPHLWPELTMEAAANRLRDCLNPDRRERLSPEQFVLILRLANEAGFHGAMGYVAFTARYETPRPVQPEDQAQQLQRQFVAAVETLHEIQRQMERVQSVAAPVRGLRSAS